MTDAVVLDGIRVVFGPRMALDSVCLTVAAGETVAIVGPSGSGKSTLLGVICGALSPTAGSVTIGGRPLARLAPGRELSRLVGIIHQQFDLVPQLPVIQKVLAGRLGEWSLARSLLSLVVPQQAGAADRALAAGALALMTATIGARNVAFGELRGSQSRSGRFLAGALFVVARICFGLTRAVPELVWALLVVFAMNPGVLPGAIALAIHNFGILGKLASEAVEDLDTKPIRSLQRSGASQGQLLAYGVLPMLLPQFLTYLLYRWEVIIRTTIVVGVVGAGGLGREFRLAMSFFHYTDVLLLLIVYFLLVVGVDILSAGLRRLSH